jgi:hypothetical protein
MERDTRENLLMIKEKVMEPSLGLMEDNISVTGKEVNNMAKECTSVRMVLEKQGNGKMEEKLDG